MLRFHELFEAAEASGVVLAERYRSDGDSHRAQKTLEDCWWEERLGLPDWNWQAGLPPGWAELAARTPRVRDDWQPAKPRPRGWRRLLGAAR